MFINVSFKAGGGKKPLTTIHKKETRKRDKKKQTTIKITLILRSNKRFIYEQNSKFTLVFPIPSLILVQWLSPETSKLPSTPHLFHHTTSNRVLDHFHSRTGASRDKGFDSIVIIVAITLT